MSESKQNIYKKWVLRYILTYITETRSIQWDPNVKTPILRIFNLKEIVK